MKAQTIILLAAALPVFVTAPAVAADLRFGKAEALAPVSVATDTREQIVRARARPQGMNEDERLPLAYGAFALAEEGTDEDFLSRPNVRLYSVAGSDAPARDAATAAAASTAKEDGERARRMKKASLPAPGSWAMILAGLLGVGAIARRRMSA